MAIKDYSTVTSSNTSYIGPKTIGGTSGYYTTPGYTFTGTGCNNWYTTQCLTRTQIEEIVHEKFKLLKKQEKFAKKLKKIEKKIEGLKVGIDV